VHGRLFAVSRSRFIGALKAAGVDVRTIQPDEFLDPDSAPDTLM
jgi:hypothetical protein